MTIQHSPTRTTTNNPVAPGGSDMAVNGNNVPPTGDNAPLQEVPIHNVEAIQNLRIPPFWKEHPEIWFFQIESLFQANNVRSDASKYHVTVGGLSSDALLVVADIVKAPPAADKYTTLKQALISRLTDSADHQLHKALTELELGNRKPSQLLREMKSLAGERASEDVIRVRWLACLPHSIQSLLRVFQSDSTLEKLAQGADTLLETAGHSVMAASTHSKVASPSAATPVSPDPQTQELREIRNLLTQLISLNKDLLTKVNKLSNGARGRSQSQARSVSASKQSKPCFYHEKFGKDARNCIPPCSFQPKSSSGN